MHSVLGVSHPSACGGQCPWRLAWPSLVCSLASASSTATPCGSRPPLTSFQILLGVHGGRTCPWRLATSPGSDFVKRFRSAPPQGRGTIRLVSSGNFRSAPTARRNPQRTPTRPWGALLAKHQKRQGAAQPRGRGRQASRLGRVRPPQAYGTLQVLERGAGSPPPLSAGSAGPTARYASRECTRPLRSC